MDWKIYDYSSFWAEEISITYKEPRIEAVIMKNGKSLEQIAIVDSGASISMISAEALDYFDINKAQCEKIIVGGIVGNPVEAFLCEKTALKVDKFDDPIEIPVLFVPGLQTNMLLGQRGFFENFRIKFENKENTFSLISLDEEREYQEEL